MDAYKTSKPKIIEMDTNSFLCIVNMGRESKPYNMWVVSYELLNGYINFVLE